MLLFTGVIMNNYLTNPGTETMNPSFRIQS
nr:MAG TPA: Serine/threonine-protein phosphatase [Bacteriophage sp.]